MDITLDVAKKVLKTVDAGLVSGVGEPVPGSMCVEAAVCYAMGLPHGDDPVCVSRALRSLKIKLNDSNWSSKDARAKGLRRLALIQLGSRDVLDDVKFAQKLSEMTIKKQVPLALRAAASVQKDSNHRSALLLAAYRCEKEGTKAAANAAYATYAATYAANAADYAANAAYAAYAAYAAANAAANAATYAARDKMLAGFAEDVVQLLIEMNVPGVQWLYLAPLEEK